MPVDPGEGTLPELVVYGILEGMGYKVGVDFTFQSAKYGGRLDRGGLVIDFLFNNPPGLAINPLGEYFHYQLRGGTRAEDLMERELLESDGITLIFIDEGDLMGPRARWFVEEALRFRDHSKLARGD